MTSLHIATDYPLDDLDTARLASARLRLGVMMDVADKMKLRVSSGFTVRDRDCLLYLGKLSPATPDSILIQILRSLEKHKGRVIVDYTDDWLTSDNERGRLIYKTILRYCSTVVASSNYLANQIISWDSSLTVSVIADLLEFQSVEQQDLKSKSSHMLWFGHPSNLPSLVSWLQDNRLGEFQGTLHAVTALSSLEMLRPLSQKQKFSVVGYDWSPENIIAASSACGACIIPAHKKGASENRLVSALALGLPTIADKIPSYEQFDQYFVDSSDHPKVEALMRAPADFQYLCRNAQQNVIDKYSRASLSVQWASFLQDALAPDTPTLSAAV